LISQASVQSSLSQVSAMFLLPFPGRTSSWRCFWLWFVWSRCSSLPRRQLSRFM
jgi:hypothetical protein